MISANASGAVEPRCRASAARRSTPSRFAPICASRSPRRSSGVRELDANLASTAAVRSIGGNRSPSSSISSASGGIEPGAMPPRSAWCARFAAQPTSSVVDEARRHERDVVEVRPPGERVVEHDLLTGPHAMFRGCVDRGVHGSGHRAEMHGNVLRLHEQIAVGGEQRGRAVGALLDVGAVRGAAQHTTHLLGDADEARDQHLQRGGVESHGPALRSRIQAPSGPGSAVQPSGTQTVQSASATTCGPTTRRRTTSGSASMSSGASRRAGPQRDHLDRGVGAGVAVAARVLVVERVDRRDGELVALSRVAAVDERLGSGSVAAHERNRLPSEAVERVVQSVGLAGRRPAADELALRAESTAARRPRTRPPAAARSPRASPSASATAHAWSGPAPPNATSASSRGSTPRSTVTDRTARSIAASTTAIDTVGRDSGLLERRPRRGAGPAGRDRGTRLRAGCDRARDPRR